MPRLKRNEALDALADTALDAIGYVGMANYAERQAEAEQRVRDKLESLRRPEAPRSAVKPSALKGRGNRQRSQ
jgi:hypothetical protein